MLLTFERACDLDFSNAAILTLIKSSFIVRASCGNAEVCSVKAGVRRSVRALLVMLFRERHSLCATHKYRVD